MNHDQITALLVVGAFAALALLGFLLWLDNHLATRSEAKRLAALNADAALYAPGRDANKAAFDAKGSTR